MKKNIIIIGLLILASACKKKSITPEVITSTEVSTTNDVLFYISGEVPVSVNPFGKIFKYEGPSETAITKEGSLYSACSVSPDRTKIVCLRAYNNDIHKAELVVLNSGGSNESVIVPFFNSIAFSDMSSPQWLTNDKILLVAGGRLATINSNGTGNKFISKILYAGNGASAFYIMNPSVSPDGKKIAYVRRPVGDSETVVIDNIEQRLPVNTELYVAHLTTGFDSTYNEKRLTNNGYNLRELYPAWSPDGKRIVYCQATRDYNTSKIYSCDGNGDNIKLLLNNGNDNSFTRWSSDGKRIYYQSYNYTLFNGSLFSCDATDGYGESLILKGDGSRQHKQFFNIIN